MPLYRAGLVGTGGIARAHARACKMLDQVELSAVCDISEDALDRFGEEFGVSRRYTDLNRLLADETLDIMIISNWGAHHAETGITIARSRKVRAILCEKPFTSNAEEARTLVAACRENQTLIAEAFKFRHHPMHLRAKEIADSGGLGRVHTIRSTFSVGGNGGPENRRPESNWRFNRVRGGGSVYDLGCYCIHHARFMFDAEPVRLFAVKHPGVEVDDAAFILMEFPDERVAQISVGWNHGGGEYAEICGNRGMLRMERVWNNEDHPTTLSYRTGDREETITFRPVFQFALQLQHLLDCLDAGRPHRISPESSVNQMAVIDAIFESMETGKAVEMK